MLMKKAHVKIVPLIKKGTYLSLCILFSTQYNSKKKVLENKQSIIGIGDKALIVFLGSSCPADNSKFVKIQASTLKVICFRLFVFSSIKTQLKFSSLVK